MHDDPQWRPSTHQLARLTGKQRDVLAELAQHKTSKEISRSLGISPHTVDQRIDSARRLLNGASRRELIQAWLEYQQICQKMTYEESPMAAEASSVPLSATEERDQPSPKAPERTKSRSEQSEDEDYRVLPELFEGKSGTVVRIAVIAVIAVLFAITMLTIMSIYLELSGFLRK